MLLENHVTRPAAGRDAEILGLREGRTVRYVQQVFKTVLKCPLQLCTARACDPQLYIGIVGEVRPLLPGAAIV